MNESSADVTQMKALKNIRNIYECVEQQHHTLRWRTEIYTILLAN